MSLADDLVGIRKQLDVLMARAEIRLTKGLDTLPLTGEDGFLAFGDACKHFLDALSLPDPSRSFVASISSDSSLGSGSDEASSVGYLLLLGCVDLKGFDQRVMLEDLLDEYNDIESELPTSGVLLVRDPDRYADLLPYLIENAVGVIE